MKASQEIAPEERKTEEGQKSSGFVMVKSEEVVLPFFKQPSVKLAAWYVFGAATGGSIGAIGSFTVGSIEAGHLDFSLTGIGTIPIILGAVIGIGYVICTKEANYNRSETTPFKKLFTVYSNRLSQDPHPHSS